MTTGKLNCVSEQRRQASRNPEGISAAMGKHAATAWQRCCARLEAKLCPNLTFKRRCKQRLESAGMACEGRARNRMLRKRWIVRNPVVGEDDITQLILARPFNTSWLHCLFLSVAKGGGEDTFLYEAGRYFHKLCQIDDAGLFCCLRNLRGILKLEIQVCDAFGTQRVLSSRCQTTSTFAASQSSE